MTCPDLPVQQRVPAILGDDNFIARVVSGADLPSVEVRRAERAWKSLEHYAREAASRNEAIRAAYASGNYSQADIARHFGVHYSSVSRVIGNSSYRECCNSRPDTATP